MKAIGVLWDGQKHVSDQTEQQYALVTNLGTICRLLDVELVCDWNADYDRCFGAYAHVVLPSLAADVMKDPKLKQLMKNNADSFSMPLEETMVKDTEGLSNEVFVPLSDVPDLDLVWKSRTGKYRRSKEGPNHFADMDVPDPLKGGKTLLELCADPQNVDPAFWEEYYEDVKEEQKGTLPFRVAQICDAMVKAVQAGDRGRFVGAAGILTHYIFDACMPLHISSLYDGNQNGPKKKIKEGEEDKWVPLAHGMHAEFDKQMVEYHTEELKACLKGLVSEKDQANAPVAVGFIHGTKTAAVATVALMRDTFALASPAGIVNDYENILADGQHDTPRKRCDALWTKYGDGMQKAMAEGIVLTARLWQAAWEAGDGRQNIHITKAVKQSELLSLYKPEEESQDPEFLTSMNLAEFKDKIPWDG